METNDHRQALIDILPAEPLYGVNVVAESMANVRRLLRPADLQHLEPFAFSYHAVTNTVDDQRIAQFAYGMPYFRQPQVLDTAIGIFSYHQTKQLSGDTIEQHWKPLMEDERTRFVDKGTQASLGYIAHIGGDLARTVYETSQSDKYDQDVIRDYVKHDYPKIDHLLGRTARKIAPELIQVGNKNVRSALVNIAMTGITLGRQQALRDYRNIVKAGSDDERQFIIERSHLRTAKLGERVLDLSYMINKQVRKDLRSSQRPLAA